MIDGSGDNGYISDIYRVISQLLEGVVPDAINSDISGNAIKSDVVISSCTDSASQVSTDLIGVTNRLIASYKETNDILRSFNETKALSPIPQDCLFQPLLAEYLFNQKNLVELLKSIAEGNIRHDIVVHGEMAEPIKLLIESVEDRKRLEEDFTALAYYDPLTKLPNRSLFDDRLQYALTHAKRTNGNVGLMHIELDRFKLLNNAFMPDHGSPDYASILIKLVSERLSTCLRQSDTLARVSRDEFYIILIDFARTENSMQVVRKVLNQFNDPFIIDDREYKLTASIGISIYPTDSSNPTTLIKNAGLALHHVRSGGGNNFEYYSSDLNQSAIRRMSLEDKLRNAIRNEELLLYYQPQIDIKSGMLAGFEALLRWNSRDFGFVMPGDFIPIAEDTGLIVPIGQWVIERACLSNTTWQEKGLPNVRVGINLSARQFKDNHLDKNIKRILDDTGLLPGFLEVEITESMLMDDVKKTTEILSRIREMGVKVSIDDFGTGYSSLSYLRNLPVDTIKIDRAFVKNCASDPYDSVILSAIIAMAHSLKIKVIAEGVETIEQFELLRSFMCDEAQGFFFNRPLPESEAMKLLQDEIFVRNTNNKNIAS